MASPKVGSNSLKVNWTWRLLSPAPWKLSSSVAATGLAGVSRSILGTWVTMLNWVVLVPLEASPSWMVAGRVMTAAVAVWKLSM